MSEEYVERVTHSLLREVELPLGALAAVAYVHDGAFDVGDHIARALHDDALARGGSGDVLTGLIAGFITQGFPVAAACHLGVYLHGAAADRQAMRKGPWGYLASDVIAGLPSEIRRLLGP